MNCPIDGTRLVITERSGVEIDYCPQCRGVWLQRGELDKIIEHSAAYSAPPPPPQPEPSRGYDNSRFRKTKKRGGFLEDLFDF